MSKLLNFLSYIVNNKYVIKNKNERGLIKMKKFDLLGNDCKTYKVDEEYLIGISDIDDIKELREISYDMLEVTYKDDTVVYYRNVFGSWGFPCVFK